MKIQLDMKHLAAALAGIGAVCAAVLPVLPAGSPAWLPSTIAITGVVVAALTKVWHLEPVDASPPPVPAETARAQHDAAVGK